MNLWIESFGRLVTADLAKKYTFASDCAILATSGPRGGKCLDAGPFGAVGKVFTNPAVGDQTAIVGVRFKHGAEGTGSGRYPIAIIQGAANTVQLSICPQADGSLKVYRGDAGGTLLATSAAGILISGTWYYLELVAFISTSVGTVTVYLNNTELTELTKTGVNTANSGVSAWSGVKFQGAYVADVYVNDGSGSTDTTRWGEVRCDPHPPVSDGVYSDFTPSAGSDNFATIDEDGSSEADFNASGTALEKDVYNMLDLIDVGGTIKGVQLNVLAKKSDAGSCGLKPICRSDGTDYEGTERFPSDASAVYFDERYPVDPATSSPFTESGLNAAQFGYKKSI